jgi:hypothetical protein
MQVDQLQTARRDASQEGGGPVKNGPIDIIMLTHNRLEHLVATVDALEARTPEPYRLTIVDNASGPAVRNWLAENAHRFEQVIYRPTNEHVPGFNHGIAATTSDPFVLTDPDAVVPDLQPSWLARMLDLVERHPDFGLIGLGCDPSNRPPPPILEPEAIDPATVVNGEIVETGVGTIFQFIRRDALVTDYRSDGQACTSVRRAGHRVGWTPGLRALHLGWDDFRLYPGHLLSKRVEGKGSYPESYGEVNLIRRPPTVEELALAAPAIAQTRRLGIPDEAVLELAWDGPVVGAAVPASTSVEAPADGPLPFADSAAGAIVLKLPPAGRAERLLLEACRIATHQVVAVAPLETFLGRSAAELAPPGWTGCEAAATGDLPLALARAAQGDPELAKPLESSTADDRERWLELFAAGTFGDGALRLWIWERTAPTAMPERVVYDAGRVTAWQPPPMAAPAVRARGPLASLWDRADLAARAEVWLARLRRSRHRTNRSEQ